MLELVCDFTEPVIWGSMCSLPALGEELLLQRVAVEVGWTPGLGAGELGGGMTETTLEALANVPVGSALPRLLALGWVRAAPAGTWALQEEAGVACGVCFLPPSLGEHLVGWGAPLCKPGPGGLPH